MDAQFTEDEIAKARHPCKRPACDIIIEVGENRYYVGNRNTAGLGKMVCGACYKHYNQKLSTTVRECLGCFALPLAAGSQAPVQY